MRYLNLLPAFFGFVSPEKLTRSLELFSTEVMPRFAAPEAVSVDS